MITGRTVRNKPYLTQMTALDAMLCMDYANGVDPFRGAKWLQAFDRKAVQLGYRPHGAAVCHCCGSPHGPECGLVKTTKYPPTPVIPFDSTDNPADGIVITPTQYPFLSVYENPEDMHRHKCPDCGTVWEHCDNRAGSDSAHTCPQCGCFKPGWVFSRRNPSTFDDYSGHLAPDYSERFNLDYRGNVR